VLREIWRTVPLSYYKEGQRKTGLDIVYHPEITSPYIETFNTPLGLMATTIPAPNGYSVYLVSTMDAKYHPGFDVDCWRIDSQTGVEMAKYAIKFVGEALSIYYMTTARSGTQWYAPGGGGTLYKFHWATKVQALKEADDKPIIEVDHLYAVDGEMGQAHFENAPTIGGPFAMDDQSAGGGTYLQPVGRGGGVAALGVWTLTTGKWRYDIVVPHQVMDIALEDPSRAYLLLANRTVALLDYTRGEILGAAKIPPLKEGQVYGDGGLHLTAGARIAYDRMYKRLMLIEPWPDNPNGSCATVVRGFSLVNEPNRLTTPFPLKVPRMGRTVPVLVQVVDDLNQGVGNFIVEATVSGVGSLVGTPITDYRGDALIYVACIGSPLFQSPPDTSPPPSTGPGVGGDLGIPVIGKPMWVGFFEFPPHTEIGDLAYLPPANCLMWVDEITRVGPIKNIVTDAIIAQWIQGTSVGEINTKVAATSGPAVAYWDHRDWPSWPTLRTGDWLALQAYCRAEETAAQFEVAMQSVIATAPSGNDICLVCQCYTSNTNNTNDLAGLVPVYARLARDFPEVTMLLVFSDQGRATGMMDHPDVKPYWEELYEGVEGDPGLMASTLSFDTGSSSGGIVGTVTVIAKIRVPLVPTIGVPSGQSATTPPAGSGGGTGGGGTPPPTTPPPPGTPPTTPPTGGGTPPTTPPSPPGTPPPGGGNPPVPPPNPAPPGGGTDPGTGAQETAPNMYFKVREVYDSRPWRLTEPYKYEADGAGAFTEAVTVAIHDVNAKFAHLSRNPGQVLYNGHSVDSIAYKAASGNIEVIQVVSTIMTGNATPGTIMWQWISSSLDTGQSFYPVPLR